MTDRFWANVAKGEPDECWLWTGKRTTDGYGYFRLNGRTLRAHRAAMILHAGSVPAGMHVDHMCRNRLCVNPAHLRVVTAKQNTLENSEAVTAVNARKTHCPKGHPLSGDNLTPAHLKMGWRSCKTCLYENIAKRRGKPVFAAHVSGGKE